MNRTIRSAEHSLPPPSDLVRLLIPSFLLLFLLLGVTAFAEGEPSAPGAGNPPAASPSATVGSPGPNEADGISFGPPEAARMLQRYMAAIDDREFDVHASAVPFLRKVLVGYAHLKDSAFPGPRYLMHANGRVEPYSLEGVVAALRDERIGVTEGRGQKEIAEAVISVDRPGVAVLLGSEDIPGYCRRPMEADFSATLRPPWFYEDRGRTYWILYTYSRSGGVVTRYRFPFRGNVLEGPVAVIEVGTKVGEYEE